MSKPKKNTAYYYSFPAIDSTSPANYKTGLTISDEAYYKDGAGAWTSLPITDTVTEIGATGIYEIDFTAAEFNHDKVVVKFSSAGMADDGVLFDLNTKLVDDLNDIAATDIVSGGAINTTGGAVDNVTTTTNLTTNNDKTNYSLSATGLDAIVSTSTGFIEISKAVWDRVISKANHNIAQSAGRTLRLAGGAIFADGTAQAGSTISTIKLAAGTITYDGQFRRAKVITVGGTGVDQEAIITGTTALTDVADIAPEWSVTPDDTTEYQIIPAQVHSTIRNGGYDDGYVYLDAINGRAGVEPGIIGTTTDPSSVIADARTTANGEKIRQFDIKGGGSFILDQSYIDWIFRVTGPHTLQLNNQDIARSVFIQAGISGTTNSTDRFIFDECALFGPTLSVCTMLDCGFGLTTTLTSEDTYYIFEGRDLNPLAAAPIIDVQGDGVTPTRVHMLNYHGRVELQNITSVDEIIITGNARVTLNANCTGGSLIRGGDIHITDNSGNVTITDGAIADIESAVTVDGVVLTAAERNATADAFLDRDMSTGVDSGSPTVRTPRQALRASRNKVGVAGGVMTVTKEDDTTPSWTANVTTTAGDPISEVDPT